MNNIAQLVKQHKKLIEQYFSSGNDDTDLQEAEDFIILLRKSGGRIFRSYERDQIRSIYFFWKDYVFSHEKRFNSNVTYQLDDIYPYSDAPVRPRAAVIWLILIFFFVCLFAVLSFSLFRQNLTGLSGTELPPNHEGVMLPSLIAASTETSCQQQTRNNELNPQKTITLTPDIMATTALPDIMKTPE